MGLVDKNNNSIVLDGAWRRPAYFENAVDFEIANGDTNDVRCIGEALSFAVNSFNFVTSIAVLEHLNDTFLCYSERA